MAAVVARAGGCRKGIMWLAAVAEKTVTGAGGAGAGCRRLPGGEAGWRKDEGLPRVGGPPSTSHPERNKRLRQMELPA